MQAVQIDGSFGEGGGQILRSSLTLSLLTGRPLELVNIRAGRSKPGLRPQHLTAVRAVAAIGEAQLQGDAIHSQYLKFRPTTTPAAGEYHFDVRDVAKGGSAGSMTLIAQTILVPLAFAGQSSRVTLCGGTHVSWSPSFHYLQHVFLPAVKRCGLKTRAKLNTWGWYPVGQGEMELAVHPIQELKSLFWSEPGNLERVSGVARVAHFADAVHALVGIDADQDIVIGRGHAGHAQVRDPEFRWSRVGADRLLYPAHLCIRQVSLRHLTTP